MNNIIYKKFIFLFLYLLFPFLLFSQGEWNKWYFGFQAALDFNSGIPVALTNSAMSQAFSMTSSVSDSMGNLLFYGDHNTIWNKNNLVMPNGSGLLGGQNSNQPILAVPKIGEDSVYYIFSVKDGNGSWGLYYSLLDMRLDGGLGDIIASMKNIPIPTASNANDALTATRHKDNKKIWVVTIERTNNKDFYASYLIDSTGISSTPVLSQSSFKRATDQGLIRISNDGSKVIRTSDTLEVCHFNSMTGKVTPLFRFRPQQGSTQATPSGVEFSINSKYVYISENDITSPDTIAGPLFQYDATQTDSSLFIQSEYLVGYGAWSHMQMGPDGKIYVSPHEPPGLLDYNLHVINNPSVQGSGCNYHKDAVSLAGRRAVASLPQFLQRYFAYINYTGQCQGNPILFNTIVWPQIDSTYWNFGDPSSGTDDYSTKHTPQHSYHLPGIYTVQLIVKHIDNRFDTAYCEVQILPGAMPDLGPDRIICSGDSATFDAGNWPGCSYQWSDLTTSQMNIGTGQTYRTDQPGTYMVSVTNSNGCSGTDTVQLSTTPLPVVTNNPLSKSLCSGESTNIPLTSNVAGTSFHWTATLTSGNVTGYSADSGIIINQVLVNSFPVPGIVTYHIAPEIGSCIGTTVDFPVIVNPGDSVKINISASINNICEGTQVTYTAATMYGGPMPFYQWKVNGLNVGSNLSTYTYIPVSGDLVSCILTSSLTVCISNNPATSNTIQMIVNPLNPVSITISPSANPVCAGIPVTFTAAGINAGPTPFYQWKVNGADVGSNLPAYTYTPASGDLVSCILTSDATCPMGNPATSNQVIMVINSNLPVGVSISASSNPICQGSSVTFTATPTNGGANPSYQWKVNGNNVGTNNSTYQYTPANGDLVNCTLTSNVTCPTGNPATSNTITMNISSSPVVTFTRCFDSITTTTAQPFKLKGGIPLGGNYTGPGVANGILYPAVAGVGTKTITYSYTNNALCTATASIQFVIRNPSFVICGSVLTDPRDNKTYPTVKIGNQCWMAEDLNYGTEISSALDQRDNCTPEKYHNPASSIEHPASVYQWDELMNYDESVSTQGLCPPGWHVPSEADWNTLFVEYTNNGFAGSPLKYSGFSGFNALLNGARHLTEKWDYAGFATFFWSSTMHGVNKAWAHGMNEPDPSVSAYPGFRSNAFSVRCLRDY
jgi:uncharacterized protein (TIGR02145 family)